jgi:uncharacterized iron-regulated membrane protein
MSEPPRSRSARSPLKSKINQWSRRLHRWGSIAAALPLLVVICSGLLLLLKKNIAWIQPPTAPPAASTAPGPPAITFDQILAATSSVPVVEVSGWDDVKRLDMRLKDGVVKVHCDSGWEVQVCAVTGDVLHHAVRRSDLIESIHDGSFFHPVAKLAVFLPSGLTVLGLWVTGMWLWLMPYLRRSRPVPAGQIANPSVVRHPSQPARKL